MQAEKIYHWKITGALDIGGTIRPQGRRYTLIGVDAYVTKTNRKSALPLWRGPDLAREKVGRG
jgi:hypothetical protein